MGFFVIGTNHKFSPVEVRERLAFSKRARQNALLLLKERNVFNGVVIISTCNRVEIYANTENLQKGIKGIIDFICGYKEIEREILLPDLYIFSGRDAVKQLFKVCAGLDSLILGELQILGQVRASFHESENVGFCGELLKTIFHSAILNSKKLHANTKISKGKISIGSVSIDFIKQKIGSLSSKKILIIGTGKVTELVLKYLKDEGPSVIFVSSRTFEKAKVLAEEINAQAIHFDGLNEALKKTDIIITATSSPHYIIKKTTLAETMRALLIVDLAIPRDVDPGVREMEKIDLYTLEDLDEIIKRNIDQKQEEAKKAFRIIDNEVNALCQELSKLEQEQALLL